MTTCQQTAGPHRLGRIRSFFAHLYHKTVEWEKNPNFFFKYFWEIWSWLNTWNTEPITYVFQTAQPGHNMKKNWLRQCSCLDSLPRYLAVFYFLPSKNKTNKNEANESGECLGLPQLEFLNLFLQRWATTSQRKIKNSLLNSYFSYQACHLYRLYLKRRRKNCC